MIEEIEDSINKPRRIRIGKRVNKWFSFFEKLLIDDFFTVTFESEDQSVKIKNSLVKSVRQYKKSRDPKFLCTIRILYLKKEIKVWRDN